MRLVGDWREGELGQRFGDADDGFELTNCDGNGRAEVGCLLGLRNAVADRDEMRGKLLGGGRREARCAATISSQYLERAKGLNVTYDLQKLIYRFIFSSGNSAST